MKTPLSRLTYHELDALTDVMTDAEISATYGLSRTAATHARNALGIKSLAQKRGKRQYKQSYPLKPGAKRAFSYRMAGADEAYFSEIDSPRKAYWLGLLLADGWIVTEHGNPTGFAIALHERDREALELFESDLGCRGMIRRTRPNCDLFQIKLTSKLAVNDLIRCGIIPRKSKTALFPSLPADLAVHCLRGYFDGDGCVGVRGNSIIAQFTSGSNQLLLHIKNKILACHGIGSTLARDRESFVLRLYAANAIRFSRLIYGYPPHGEFSFARKREKFFSYLGSGAGRSWEQLLSDLDSAPSR